MTLVYVAVEGNSDVEAAHKLLRHKGLEVDRTRTYVTRGKATLDSKLPSYYAAAVYQPWFVLRDGDKDGGDCVLKLLEQTVPANAQSPMMCHRIAVRSIEAWLMADAATFAESFGLRREWISAEPERLGNAKTDLLALARRSTKRDIREGMVTTVKGVDVVGPEYVTIVNDYAEQAWRPEVAAEAAPSLERCLGRIEQMLAEDVWRR